ncbi:MAG: replicative DNA helicase [Synergistaceae bacterium]|jgi:replicative DNA helicase|nr:replicative DNA helicase [Synergistaceae bacterium]
MPTVYDRSAPCSLEAERAVLGACVLEQEALGRAAEILRPDDFYDFNNRSTFEVIFSMFAANSRVDLVTLNEELIKRGLHEKLGGQPFLASLIAEVPTTANVTYHAEIVRDKSLRRRLIAAGNEIVRLGYAVDVDTDSALDQSERLVFEVASGSDKTGPRPVRDILGMTFERIQQRYTDSGSDVSGFQSGFPDLDKLTGGFQPGSLNIIAARPSMGKTALALNIAQFGGGGDAVLIFSLEMSGEQLVQRMLGAEAMLNIHAMRTGAMDSEDWGALLAAAESLSKAPIYIDDSSMLTTMDFRARCRRFKARAKSENLGLIVVDYLQLMSVGARGGGWKANSSFDNKQQEVAEISRVLKGVARELECPVLALSQLSRAVEQRTEKKPLLSDLRDSGALEQDADTVMMLYRPDYYDAVNPNADSEALLTLSKNRNGPTDVVQLVFRREITRFFEKKGHYPEG